MTRRLGIVLVLALAACSAGTKPATKPDTPFTAPPAPSQPPAGRYHYDMSTFGGDSVTCDGGSGITVRQAVAETVKSRPDLDVVRARILKIGAPRWNSPSGKRPTQAEADAIVDGPLEYGQQANPSIYRPLTIQVEKVYSGATRGTVTAYAESGRIGESWVTSCAFGAANVLLVHEGPHIAAVGESYVMFLEHRLIGTVIGDLNLVQGSMVVNAFNKLEPLP